MGARGSKRKRRPPPRPSRSWTIRYALAAYAVVLVAGLVIVVSLSGHELRVGVGVLALDLVMLATLVPLSRAPAFSAADVGLRRTSPGRAVGLVVAAVVVIAIVNVLWIRGVLGQPQPNSLGVKLHEGTVEKILTGFALAVSAPVVEEIFFRGLLYRALRNRLSVVTAAILAGVLFGLIHGISFPLDTLPPRMAFGIVACLLYEATGSLYPSIALHSLIDASGFEVAVTGHNHVVFPAFIVLGAILLIYAAIRPARSGTRAPAHATHAPSGGDQPGWRPNPGGPGFRYWDGDDWTDAYSGVGKTARKSSPL
jgi:uncharacterized protein